MMLRTLIRLFTKMAIYDIKYSSSKQQASLIFAGGFLGLFGIFVSSLLGASFTVMDDHLIVFMMTSLVISIIAGTIIFSVPHVFQRLYSSTDLELLFSLPIPTQTLFIAKFYQHLLSVPLLIFIVGVGLGTITGVTGGAHWSFYPLLLINFFLFILFALAIVYFLNLLLAQFIPGSRSKELMTVMSALGGLVFILMIQIPHLFMPQVDDMEVGFTYPGWLPFTWIGESWAASFTGTFSGWNVVQVIGFSSVTAALLILSSLLVERGFRRGWVQMQSEKKTRKKPGTKRNSSIRTPVVAVLGKEFRSLKRDMREWLHFMQFLFVPLLAYVFLSGPAWETIQMHPEISWFAIQITIFFPLLLVSGQFSSTSVAREGRSLDLLHVLPIRGIHIASGKLLFHWLTIIAIISITQIICFILFGWSITHTITGIFWQSIAIAGICGIGLYIGTQFARLNEKNPQQRIDVAGTFTLLAMVTLYFLVSLFPLGLTIAPVEIVSVVDDIETSGWILNSLSTIIDIRTRLGAMGVGIAATIITAFSFTIMILTLRMSGRSFDKGISIDHVRK
ncbi:ABC-2 type transport system permease protein [Geomicrobium halophilum]|uniref:ABC-2 type transport system permease protein n=1 Tax=Geomicrobium halophilum TaxID=549000 RepID=A0A841Q022_9BACL|nr:hypothetical protein [Geomicrobium halophilum]MBB6450813.1 ABC-2 type transport system permease protein [Geomicrobium halophilum]